MFRVVVMSLDFAGGLRSLDWESFSTLCQAEIYFKCMKEVFRVGAAVSRECLRSAFFKYDDFDQCRIFLDVPGDGIRVL